MALAAKTKLPCKKVGILKYLTIIRKNKCSRWCA
jgi:hypothetical protein